MAKNTMINVSKKTREELKELIIMESFERGERIYMMGLIDEMLKFYKENKHLK